MKVRGEVYKVCSGTRRFLEGCRSGAARGAVHGMPQPPSSQPSLAPTGVPVLGVVAPRGRCPLFRPTIFPPSVQEGAARACVFKPEIGEMQCAV